MMHWRLLVPRYRMLAWAVLASAAPGCEAVNVVTHSTSADPIDAPAGVYALDPDHTTVLFKVDHLGYSLYVGRFDDISGTLDFRPDNPADSQVTVEIETDSVNSGNGEVDALLRDEAFDAETHPVIRFESTRLTATGETTGTLEGALTFHGRTQPVSLEVSFNGGAENPLEDGYTLGFSAAGELDRTDFGVGNWTPAVGKTVTLEIHTEFTQAD